MSLSTGKLIAEGDEFQSSWLPGARTVDHIRLASTYPSVNLLHTKRVQ